MSHVCTTDNHPSTTTCTWHTKIFAIGIKDVAQIHTTVSLPSQPNRPYLRHFAHARHIPQHSLRTFVKQHTP